MKVGVLQLNSTIGDFPANIQKLKLAYERACALGAEFAIAPELYLCGYPPRDLLLRTDFIERNLAAVHECAQWTAEVPLCVGYVDWNRERPGKPLSNAAAVLHQGKVVHTLRKCLLPTYDVFDEARYFEPAAEVQIFPWKEHRLALTICEDIWNDEDFWPERLYRRDPIKELVGLKADCILNLSASPWHQGKERTRIAMLRKVAKDEGLPLVQVNMVGGNDELIFDGQSVALDARGELLRLGRAFGEDLFIVDLAAELTPAELPSIAPEEQLFSALSLGIKDYIQKCGFKSVVIGLSGGIDSALTAVLAVDALGPEKVMGVAMPSKYSSPGSLSDAEALARNLGIRYEVIPIGPMVDAVESQLRGVFTGHAPNETEENIQSRLRGLTLMALSNKFGALVLTTGNKSELAVGYCTLYGDMCGALAVIGDVFKTDIYRLSRWVNRQREIIPSDTITKPPSAELRPNQKDQDSLPEYEILDAILDLYIVKDLPKNQIVQRGFDPSVVKDVVNKVTFSEYKRRQAAPALKVSPRAFGIGRRIPIAQRFRT